MRPTTQQKAPHALCIGHADSPQFARRCALLKQAGWRITELTGRQEPVTPGTACLTPRGLPFGRFWRLLTVSRMADFFSLVRKSEPDLLFIQYAQGLWSWLAPLTGRPLVVCAMGGDVLTAEQGAPNLPERKATQGLLRRAGLVLCSSEHLNSEVQRLHPRGRIVTANWSPDSNTFLPDDKDKARQALGISKGAWTVFSPRGMQPFYRIEQIAEAFALACGQKAEARLLLTTFRAEAEYLEQVRARTRELGIADRTIFLPPQNAHGMATCFRAADVCVSFPVSDGMPQTFWEATACEAPMVMSDLPHYNKTIRHGQHALLAGPHTQDLAAALRQLLTDPTLGPKLARSAQELAQEHGSNSTPARLGELLQQCAKTPAASRLSSLPQLFWVLAALVLGRPIVARTNQPVYASVPAFLVAQRSAKRLPCVG